MSLVIKRNEDIFTSLAQCLVCPTNAVGVMGAGLAKAFRNRYTHLFGRYQRHCREHQPNDLVPYVFDHPSVSEIVYCLHTKRHWREDSQLSIVQSGLDKLRLWCEENAIQSIAIPALGCGRGNLEWKDVEPLLKEFSDSLPLVEVEIYLPYGY